MINVVIDKSGSMNTLGKPEVIQSIIRELQLTERIDCKFFLWGQNVSLASVTDGFSNEDKSNLTAFLRDNSNSKFRIVLAGADSRVINGKSFFPENMIVSEQKKYIFNAIEVSAAIESLNY